MESSDDAYNLSPFSDELHRRISFGRQGLTVSSVARGVASGPVTGLVFDALLRLDALDADGAVALLQQSGDRRVQPMLGNALMAAGHPELAIPVLRRISLGESGKALRLWVSEQIAYAHVLQREPSLAEREYSALASSVYPAFRDIGVAGLIDVALADGRGEAAWAAHQAGSGVARGSRSAARIAEWLQTRGQDGEAIEVLTRLAESGWAHDSERAWALLQLQTLYGRSGDVGRANEAGWRLQRFAPPGDRFGVTGLKMLIATMVSRRADTSDGEPFSESYQRFLAANPHATDPARQLAYAMQLRREHHSDAAAAIYQKLSSDASASKPDRASALLNLQRLQLEAGQVEPSVQTGIQIHESFPEDLNSRLASWRMIRSARLAIRRPDLLGQAEAVSSEFAASLQAAALRSTGAAQRRAQVLLLHFNQEIHPQ
jgi:hypothetical protein